MFLRILLCILFFALIILVIILISAVCKDEHRHGGHGCDCVDTMCCLFAPQTMTAGTAAAVWRVWSLMQGKDTNTAARCARRSLASPGTPESILIYGFCTLD
jgi:hypothetical protein